MSKTKNKLTNEEALAELKSWCDILGLTVIVSDIAVRVCYLEDVSDKYGYTVLIEHRPYAGTKYGKPKKRISVATTCLKIINNFFKPGAWLVWTKSKIKKYGIYNIETAKTINLKIPASDSPEELKLKLIAAGWDKDIF